MTEKIFCQKTLDNKKTERITFATMSEANIAIETIDKNQYTNAPIFVTKTATRILAKGKTFIRKAPEYKHL